MKIRLMLSFCCLVSLGIVISCSNDKEFGSVAGKWQGTKAEAQIVAFGIPLPISEADDDFNAEVEFKTDGTVSLADDGQTSSGTWEQDGNKLILSITFSTDFIDLSGTYTIKELTASTLQIYIEKDESYTDPDTGTTVDGTIKATLSFTKK